MSVPEIDQQIGIRTYATKTSGIGGILKNESDDFVVEEVLIDGSVASTKSFETKPVLSASKKKKRFLLSILVKRNWDTFIALKKLAKELDIEQSWIQIAGIKDAKAVTAQHITIEGIAEEEISKIKIRDVKLRPIGYFHEPMCSFYLLGNDFTIKVKRINNSKQETGELFSCFAREIEKIGGIPNFYGYQRFGSTRPITHFVGKAMVKGNLEEAAMLFLANPSKNEHPGSRQARAQLQANQNFAEASKNFPTQLRFERMMLHHLAAAPDDFQGAFRCLPPKLRLLFVHAWQSYLFNRFLSSRIENGLSFKRVEIGDLVVSVERSGLPLNQTAKIVDSTILSQVNDSIDAGKMRVVLPLVGFKQRLSEGVMGELEKKILEDEEVDMRRFRVTFMTELGVKGGLRAAISPVSHLETKGLSDAVNTNQTQLLLKFRLLRGSYATTFLRELVKPKDLIKSGF